MQRRHFELIANTIERLVNNQNDSLSPRDRDFVAHAFADQLRTTKPPLQRRAFPSCLRGKVMSRIAYYICTHDAKANPQEPHLGYCKPTHEAPLYLETYAADIIQDAISGNLALTRVIDIPDEYLPEESEEIRE